MAVVINGRDLTVEEVIRVCRGDEKVEIAPEAQKAIQKARDYIEKKLEEGAVIYGLTTGFGKFANVLISKEETADLQRNLIISHTCALGTVSETVCESSNAASLQRFIQRKFRYPSFHGADYGGYAECWGTSGHSKKGFPWRFWRPCPTFPYCIGPDWTWQGRV